MSQEIIIPKRITRDFIMRHREWTFLYSSAWRKEIARGQARIGIGHCNSFPIFVRLSACKSSGYFNDNTLDDIKHAIEDCINDACISGGSQIIIPFPRMGTGASRFAEFAPKAFKYMNQAIEKVAYPNITYSKE